MERNSEYEKFIANARRNFSFRLVNWPLWGGITLISIGIFFAVSIDDHTLFQKLVVAGITELGFAFFIAHIIIITVDREEKQEMRRELRLEQERMETERRTAERRVASKLYLSTVLDVDLPNNVSDELNKYILASKLLKRDQKLKYKIVNLNPFAKLIQSLDATYENVHREPYDYHPPFQSYHNRLPAVEKRHPNEVWGLLSFTLSVSRAGGEPAMEKLISWQRNSQSKHNTSEKEFDFDFDGINLKNPIRLEFGDRVRLQIEWNTPKFENDNELFTNTNFAENMVIDVEYNKDEFEVGYRCIHPRAKECMVVSEGKNYDTINFYFPFMPSNGVITWWRKL
ncbi:hypothetical protein [Hoeflea olei]|uniref:hypothetical protein n=1 Tax=Hoeflea olei TaxID=1480615 RepID=UPI001111E437|nr:hypothetical protein [Hoeflea olei]